MSSIHQGISTISGNERRAQLRAKIKKGELVIAPGVFEMISAKVAMMRPLFRPFWPFPEP